MSAKQERPLVSFIYDKLVQDEDDILGHIAYSVYKRQKIAHIKRICAEKNIDRVSDDDLKEFVAISQTDEQLQFYRERATQLANSFLDRSMKEELNAERDRLEREFLRDYKNHGFMYGVWQSIVASFLFLVIGYVLLVGTGSWEKLIARL